jgi:hypothetical protein
MFTYAFFADPQAARAKPRTASTTRARIGFICCRIIATDAADLNGRRVGAVRTPSAASCNVACLFKQTPGTS